MQPNHVLLNTYAPSSGIFDHQDGPVYEPIACILSLNSPAIMHFKPKLPQGEKELTSMLSYYTEWKCQKNVGFSFTNNRSSKQWKTTRQGW